jgi:hypothetical protein
MVPPLAPATLLPMIYFIQLRGKKVHASSTYVS